MAADLSVTVSSVHFFDADTGCISLPDILSHETWVYLSNVAACSRLIDIVALPPVDKMKEDHGDLA